MIIHSSVLAWRIPCTEEPGGVFPPVLGEKAHKKVSIAQN